MTFNMVVGGRLSASQAADDVAGFSHCTTTCRELVRGKRYFWCDGVRGQSGETWSETVEGRRSAHRDT